jgi:hypothetical protein
MKLNIKYVLYAINIVYKIYYMHNKIINSLFVNMFFFFEIKNNIYIISIMNFEIIYNCMYFIIKSWTVVLSFL